MPKGQKEYYFFQVHESIDDEDDGEPKIVTHFFRSGYEVAAFIGCSRPTVFNLINNRGESRIGKNFAVEKCEPPIPMYQKVKVENVKIF